MNQPILYSFRRCPYAIRARMALAYAGIEVEHREVVLRNKPSAMLALSPKGTVPVLQLSDGRVLDESIDIMRWALTQNDQQHWVIATEDSASAELIQSNDGEFKYYLDRYKYADRYLEKSELYYRQQAEAFLGVLEQRLNANTYLLGDHITLADVAIMPFIRQFAKVDEQWFNASEYLSLKRWLEKWLKSPLFLSVMEKYKVWELDK